MAELPPSIRALIDRAAALGLPLSSLGPDGALVSLKEAWQAAADAADIDQQIPILDLIQAFSSLKEDAPEPVVEISEDRLTALLTLPSPESGLAEIRSALHRAGVIQGVDEALVKACAGWGRSDRGWLLRVSVARGEPPDPGRDSLPEFQVPAFSTERLRLGEPWTGASLLGLKPVGAGTALGRLQPGSAGTPGKDVTGRLLPPPKPPLPLTERITLDGRGQMTAQAEGVLIQGPWGWDLLPLFLVHGDYRPESGPIRFPGLVAVEGSCRGVDIEADALLVGGDLAGGRVSVRGDVHVAGVLSGGPDAALSADGTVTARAVESAKVDALGDVLARRAIANAEVTSLGRVAVLEAGGELSGGNVAGLKGVSAPTLGSDFGVPTAVAAGRDFLTPRRLAALEARAALHQENLKKIAELKQKLALSGVDVRNLPPAKQDVFLGVLKKETGSRQELAQLERQRERFRRACADLLEATVKAGEALHPPVQVQIAGTLSRIQERLKAVVLALDGNRIKVEEVTHAPTP